VQTLLFILSLLLGAVGISTTPSEPVAPPAIVGDAARGETIFRTGVNNSPPCIACHALEPGGFALAPNLQGVHERAGSRVEGLDADAYLRQSILDPLAYQVSGFRPIMFEGYADYFGDQELADLIAFLETR
jgi:hypothetical protein